MLFVTYQWRNDIFGLNDNSTCEIDGAGRFIDLLETVAKSRCGVANGPRRNGFECRDKSGCMLRKQAIIISLKIELMIRPKS